jgi:hypothetical protein
MMAGDIEWMNAGRGVWHSGFAVPPIKAFQLWVALPPQRELAPAFSQHLSVHSGPAPHNVRCPHYSASHSLDEVPWSEAVGAWFTNEADHTLACPACGHSARIVDWTFLELDWAFGNLGFGFTNWVVAPHLALELGKVLGHHVKIVHQHI